MSVGGVPNDIVIYSEVLIVQTLSLCSFPLSVFVEVLRASRKIIIKYTIESLKQLWKLR
jgi:hypothetical protein